MQTIQRYALFTLLILVGCQAAAPEPEASYYTEKFRPQIHFTPEKNWMNDPNGLFYHKGEYHLFYQYNPFGDRWGHMSWGHAVSEDLVSWTHLPVALAEENNVMIFSGSVVVDHQNTSGFGTSDNPPLVALYTGHHTDKELQDQRIAYSTDDGRTWTKYDGNPVLDIGLKDFRDPKVFWHAPTQKWVMAVVLPDAFKVQLYGSTNLIDWTFLSDFGPSGATGGIWECPGLFELPVENSDGETRWVMQVDINPGGPAGGSGSQYFIGTFDGTTFTQDPDTEGQTRWVDWGKDYYAVQPFDNITTDDGRVIWISWMSNWAYAQDVPTAPWRSAMTLPREIGLRQYDDGIHLIRRPTPNLQKLRTTHWTFAGVALNESADLSFDEVSGAVLEIQADITLGDAHAHVGFVLAQGATERTVVGYDAGAGELYIDRTQSGLSDFSDEFAGVHRAPLQSEDGRVRLHLFLDTSSIEVFANDGRVAMTDLIFPDEGGEGFGMFVEQGEATLNRLEVWQLRSAWVAPGSTP